MKISLLKKILLILLVIALLFAITKHHKIKNSFFKMKEYLVSEEFYQRLIRHGIIKKCYAPHQDIIEILAKEGFDYETGDKKITQASLNKLQDKSIKTSVISKIPTITHKIYFTPKNNSTKLNDFYIEELKVNFNRLNGLNKKWQHIIWTNQADLFPVEVTSIKGVEIKSISEFKNHPSYKNLIEVLAKGDDFKPHLAEASDLARLMIIGKYGGIYSDMDYEIYNPNALFELMQKFDFIGARDTIRLHGLYLNGLIAAKPNHPILNEALKKSFRNYNNKKDSETPDYIKYPCNIYHEIFFNNGPMLITIAYFAKNNIEGNNDIILPSWMSINVDFARHKNQTCNLGEITKASFNQRNGESKKVLSDFIARPQVEEWQYTCNIDDPSAQSIYYNLKDHAKFDIIGADMSCGTWISDTNHQKTYYLNFPFK